MGHVTPGTTGIYTHLFRESYESVHEALDRVYASDRVPLRVVAVDREQEPEPRSVTGTRRF